MFSDKERLVSLLEKAIEEMHLIEAMSEPIKNAGDYGASLEGMTIFRACSMSLQFITESFVKIRNMEGAGFFSSYKSVPWNKVFGMRNFLSHEYVEVDENALFNTIKEDLPELLKVTELILNDVEQRY